MKLLGVGKSDAKFVEAQSRAKEMRNVQSENASMTALVLKVRSRAMQSMSMP